jgi:hypothetical protein
MTSTDAAAPSPAPAPATQHTTPNPSEVGWQFVPQYYTFVNKHPNRLHCFYTKASTFVHGTEGDESVTCHGQQVSVFDPCFFRPSWHSLGACPSRSAQLRLSIPLFSRPHKAFRSALITYSLYVIPPDVTWNDMSPVVALGDLTDVFFSESYLLSAESIIVC